MRKVKATRKVARRELLAIEGRDVEVNVRIMKRVQPGFPDLSFQESLSEVELTVLTLNADGVRGGATPIGSVLSETTPVYAEKLVPFVARTR